MIATSPYSPVAAGGIEPPMKRLSGTHTSLCMTLPWGAGVVLPHCSERDGFTVPLAEAAAFPDPEPPRGFEPRSARYQRAALPLCYGGETADGAGLEPDTRRVRIA